MNNATETLNSVNIAIFKYKSHPSVLAVKNALGATTPLCSAKFLCLILRRNKYF